MAQLRVRTNSLVHLRLPLRACGLALAAGAVAGCSQVDSYLDPSVMGRWEYTPTSVPVLDHISSIEGKPDQFVEHSPILAQDLIPDPTDYRVGPGDELFIRVFDVVAPGGVPEEYPRTIDTQGLIDIPQLGRIYVSGMNVPQISAAVTERAQRFIADALVEVDIRGRRKATFTLIGGVTQPGPYFIPKPDFRLLEAITSGGRVDTTVKEIYVIRLVPLSESIIDPLTRPPPGLQRELNPSGGTPGQPRKPVEDPLNVIDELSKPSSGGASPSMIRGGNGTGFPAPAPRQPEVRRNQPPEPAIDLPGTDSGPTPSVSELTTGGPPWVFRDGRWVQVRQTTRASEPGRSGPEPVALGGESGLTPAQLLTQRVIKVPMDRLLAGDSTVNIIVKPEDVIRIPTVSPGEFYMAGFVARPGVYQIPETGKMTVLRAITTAGGLSPIAIPERAELIRALGNGRQAAVSINLRAIAEFTQPDIVIKPDDQINVGTNFWAQPLAVFRNGLRATYGFGFLLDRNFGNDVFGLPPEYQTRQQNPFPF
ncbi:MAG: polysaccharide biosynthesis/export family protein [Phycisphaeraceae bacterium]|nr:MAG: polysaccharide biosynthesis/export family protein [Phycisphaeraceae bacterium]